MNQKLQTIRYWLLLALVAAAPMSFSPSISLPLLDFPSFRIGLYQILAVLFILACLPLAKTIVFRLFKSPLAILSSTLVLISLAAGLATSLVPARTMLYETSLLSLLVLGIAAFTVWRTLSQKQISSVIQVLLWSGAIYGTLAMLQLVVGTFDRTALGTLCTGCSDAVFGFPRINLFAAEPQFFANSLFPALFAALLVKNRTKLATWSLALSSFAVGLTFSRGSFLAIAVTFVTLIIIFAIQRRPLGPLLRAVGLSSIAVVVSLACLVTSSSLRYHDTPNIAFNTAVSMIDHLSLGRIHIAQKSSPQPPTTASQANFTPEGFVAASSNDRLNAAGLALNAWNDSAGTMLLGVGMGNLGSYVNAHIAAVPSNLTVYIWYVLVLAELGLMGLIGLLIAPLYILWKTLRQKDVTPLLYIAFSVTLAFVIQLFSFGSYINVMYHYLFLGIFIALLNQPRALRRD